MFAKSRRDLQIHFVRAQCGAPCSDVWVYPCEVGSTFARAEGRGRPHTTHGDGAGALGGLFTAFVLYVEALAKREPYEKI